MTDRAELIARLRRTASEIRAANICGWGNVIDEAIAALEAKPEPAKPLPESVDEWIARNAFFIAQGASGVLPVYDTRAYIRGMHSQHQAELELLRSKLALVLRENRRLSDVAKAVDHELVTMGSTLESYPDASKAVAALIDWNCQVAIDPSVSNDARALIEHGSKP